MTLVLVIAASAVAIALLVLLNALLRGWTPARLGGLEDAAAELAAAFLDFRPGAGALAQDGRAALVEDQETGKVGLVAALGDRFVARRLGPEDVRAARVGEDGALALALADFTWPGLRLRLADAATARAWAARLVGADEG